ncbi:MAG: hypothetical protein MUO27_03495 [Sedimentisphaerales bacterium]|nr:hypothetical protein [Sedimentisphaerales bacterium]
MLGAISSSILPPGFVFDYAVASRDFTTRDTENHEDFFRRGFTPVSTKRQAEVGQIVTDFYIATRLR